MNCTRANAPRLLLLSAVLILGGCLSGLDDPIDASAESPNPGPTPGNNAPIISGNPPSAVKVGEAYAFTPNASDPDGDALTFSIENRPAWADFNASTGRISGTPTLGDIGSFDNIRVTASDGELAASTPRFRIDVTQTGTVSTTLSWTAPSENEDGTPLTDLSGFKLYYGRSSGSYSNQIRIDNPTVTTYVVENLSPGTYFFAATAFNSMGVESQFSGEAVKSLN